MDVNSTVDERDAIPGDGICATVNGSCTLRAAVMEANATNGSDTIRLQLWNRYELERGGGEDDDAGQTGDLDVYSPISISGRLAKIDGNNSDNVLDVHGGVTVTTTDLGLVIENPLPWARGISADGGTQTHTRLSLEDAALELSGVAVTFSGGSFRRSDLNLDQASTMVLRDAAVHDGSVIAAGRATVTKVGISAVGLRQFVFGANSSLSGVTVAAPQSTFEGGPGTVVQDSTFDGSVRGGAQFTNSVFAVPAPEANGQVRAICDGAKASGGWNLAGDTSCGFGQPSDIQGVPVALAPAGPYGGSSWSRLLMPGSPGIDSGRSGCSGTDQRGKPRLVDGNGDGAAVCDRGATELGPRQSLTMTVDRTNDAVDANIGDGVCAIAGGGCTLRAAVLESAVSNGADTITIQPGITIVRASTRGSADLPDDPTVDDHDIVGPLTINGSGSTLYVRALGRGFQIHPGSGEVSMNDLTIEAGGVEESDQVAGIANGASLTVRGLTYNGGYGIGIGNEAGADVLVDRSHFHLMQGSSWGNNEVRPIVNWGTATIEGTRFTNNYLASINHGTMTVRNSEFSLTGHRDLDNRGTLVVESSTFYRDGIDVVSGSHTHVRDSTIDGSIALGSATGSGGPIEVTLRNSYLKGCGEGLITSLGYNLTGSDCGFAMHATDLRGVDPLLGAIADNGGPTRTFLPQPGSPLIDSGDPDCLVKDQRGVTRPQGSACDRGAVEVAVGPDPPSP